ncbi:MAG: integrase domain-containing protein [Desulfurivibrionaceae bacterium]
MSRKTQLKKELHNLAARTPGSGKTHDARKAIAQRLANTLHQIGYPLRSISEIRVKHIETYVQQRKQEIRVRSIHNDMTHIRQILKEAGKHKIAEHNRLRNERLCGGKAERIPARTAPDPKTAEQIISTASEKDAGVGAGLQLQKELGLRSEEAVKSVKSLGTWERQLQQGDKVRVVYGTKGGRPRDTRVPNVQQALTAVKTAREVADQRAGKLIDKPNIDSALRRYNRVAAQAGAKGAHSPHSLRYFYTQNIQNKYQEQGYSQQEARALTSQDLGHGDGRGRWVASVYNTH